MVREDKDIKVFIGGYGNQSHFGWLDRNAAEKLKELIDNRAQWIKDKCKEQFGFELSDKNDYEKFDEILKENFYTDKSDWLREKVREELRKYEAENNK